MDELNIYLLMRALDQRKGFSIQDDGSFAYWGVPLDEIDVNPMEFFENRFQGMIPKWHPLSLTMADYYALAREVDLWFARRHIRARLEA